MAFVDIQLCVNAVFYFFIFVCGFAISVPIGVTNIENDGGCFLYATLDVFNKTKATLYYSQKVNCNYPIYLGVFACIFYALGMGIYHCFAIYKSRNDPTIASQMWVMPFVLLNSLVTFGMFVASCIVSVGLAKTCSSLTEKNYFSSCSAAQNKQITTISTGVRHSTGHFYSYINVTQTASWFCTLGWAALVVSGVVRAVLNRRLRAQGSAALESPVADTTKIATVEPTA